MVSYCCLSIVAEETALEEQETYLDREKVADKIDQEVEVLGGWGKVEIDFL